MIFTNFEINKINLETLFFRILKIPMVKIYLSAEQILQRPIFKFHKKNNIFGYADSNDLHVKYSKSYLERFS